MSIFIDTAAFLAVLNADDQHHSAAKRTWEELVSAGTILFSSNYVIIETIALLQHRYGLDAVRLLEREIIPAVEIIWVDDVLHRSATSALLAANRRRLSLVDCLSFEIMHQKGLEIVFTFDNHFQEQGFSMIPTRSGAIS